MLNAYLYALREHANERQRFELDSKLEPPNIVVDGKPLWWTSEEDAWQEWNRQL